VDGYLESYHFPDGRIIYKGKGKDLQIDYYEFKITDHLGDLAVTFREADDGQLEVLQRHYYYPFGMNFRLQSPVMNTPTENRYQYNGKELEKDMGINLYDYGARWYDAAVGRWTSVDPLAEKYAGWSTYSYTFSNPIRYVDPNGMAPEDIIFYNAVGVEVHRVASKTINRVYVVNSDDGTLDFNPVTNFIQGANTVETAQMFVGMAPDKFSEATGVSLRFVGRANENNVRQADGILTVSLQFGDNRTMDIGSYDAISGPYGRGALENGNYEIGRVGPPRNPSSSYSARGVAFTVDIEPLFDTERNLLRIHPDGGTPGTMGCVGLTRCTAGDLSTFYNNMKTFTKAYNGVHLNVNIENNPNNDGRENNDK